MGYKIEEIIIDNEIYNDFKVVNYSPKLPNLSRINIFIGANNSGKSRFLRKLFTDDKLKFKVEELKLEKLNQIINDLKNEVISFFDKHRIEEFGGIRKYLNGLKTIESINIDLDLRKSFLEPINKIIKMPSSVGLTGGSGLSHQKISQELQQIGNKYHEKMEGLLSVDDKIEFEKIYIPTLRGLRPLSLVEQKIKDSYSSRTKNDYFKGIENIESKIFTGLSLYDDTKKLLLGRKQERDKVREFEDFLSKNFFNEKEVNIVPNIDDDVLHIRIEDEEFPIYHLGDGIQSLIILTYPLFFNQGKNLLVFIDEPELFLHPGMQRIFIETIMQEEFKSFQFFITTHSNHLLDLTLDLNNVSIYSFKKHKDENKNLFLIENVENEDLNILELLGVRNSSVFLSNTTIWVEGITDRFYLRKYLEIFQNTKDKKFKEDVHYSFVEYGGGNITHWAFLKNSDDNPLHKNIEVKNLCGRLFLISDKDGAGLDEKGNPIQEKIAKYERHKELETFLTKERYSCLSCREIENLLKPEILKSIVQSYEANKGNKDELEFNNFEYELYKDTLLGSFINDNVENRKKNYKDESGTINDKVNFAKKAISFIKNIDDMSDEAIKLCEKIYEFISKNN